MSNKWRKRFAVILSICMMICGVNYVCLLYTSIKMQICHLHHWNNTSAGELPVENIEQPNFICIEQQTVHSKRKSDSQNQILRLH